MDQLNKVTEQIIGAAIDVHRGLGPGLLESAYDTCMRHEFHLRGIEYQPQRPLPVSYKGINLDCGFRLDFLVVNQIVVELKAVQAILPIHEAQLLTHMKLGGWKLGLLLNFNVELMKDGIRRRIL